MARQGTCTIRQGAYDLRKLRARTLVGKPRRVTPLPDLPDAALTITALLTLRDHVIALILAGVRSHYPGRKSAH